MRRSLATSPDDGDPVSGEGRGRACGPAGSRPGPDEVVVAAQASGLCHTDIEMMRGTYGTPALPVVSGHARARWRMCGRMSRGWPPEARIEIAPFDTFRRRLRLAGSHSLNRNIPAALATIRAIGPDMARMVSHSPPLEGVADVRGNGTPPGSLGIQAVPG